MLQYAKHFRDRLMLRINHSNDETFRVRNVWSKEWELLGNRTFGGHSAALRGSVDGERVDIMTHTGISHTFLVANTETNHVVANIEIGANGDIMFNEGPHLINVAEPLNAYWSHRTVMIIGIPGPCTVNMRDFTTKDEDIFRLKMGHNRMFIPSAYQKSTPAYDIERAYDAPTAPEGKGGKKSAEAPSTSQTPAQSGNELASGIEMNQDMAQPTTPKPIQTPRLRNSSSEPSSDEHATEPEAKGTRSRLSKKTRDRKGSH